SHRPGPRRDAPAVTGAHTPKTWPRAGPGPPTALPGAPLAALPPAARHSGRVAGTLSASLRRVRGTGAPPDLAVRAPPGRGRPVLRALARPGRLRRGPVPPGAGQAGSARTPQVSALRGSVPRGSVPRPWMPPGRARPPQHWLAPDGPAPA